MEQAIDLRADSIRASLRPDLGGCLAGLWWQGIPVLRSTPALQLQSVRQSACYPLIPYSNRLGFCQFRWEGISYQTQPNFLDSVHSLHGCAWQRSWSVTDYGTQQLRLTLQHQPDADWPFAFTATQHLRLYGDASLMLEWTLTVQNTDKLSQPLGLGWHPYFPLRPQTHLHTSVTTQWLNDARGLPLQAQSVNGIDQSVSDLALDHCFGGWSGRAHIRDAQLSLVLECSLPWLVVFTPTERGFFCVEPVSHRNNALHETDATLWGIAATAPGQTLSATMRLRWNTNPLTPHPHHV